MYKRGFTLVEVLITLGIIGVVAALTIPALLNNMQDQQYKTAYKKAYSSAQQALTSAAQQELLEATTYNDKTNIKANFLAFMSQFKVIKQCITGNNSECWATAGESYGKDFSSGLPYPGHPEQYAFIDASGIAWSMCWDGDRYFVLDTNGFEKPNQYGKDRFLFLMLDQNKSTTDGIPTVISPVNDNDISVCTGNSCGTVGNKDYKRYYGYSWLYN